MNDNALQRIDEATRCQNCHQTYQDPRMLSCGHSFCRKCIARYVVMKSVSCPSCKKSSHVPHGDVENLIKNLTITGLVDSYRNPYATPCFKCADCKSYERREAVNHCYTCQDALCSLCSQSHTNLHHSLTDVRTYESESMKFRDKTTESLVSRTGVKLRTLEQRLQLVTAQGDRVKSVTTKLTSDIQLTYNQHIAHLHETRDLLVEEANEREDFMLEKLKTVKDFTKSYMETLNKISSNLLLGNRKCLRGETLRTHIKLCHELEALLQDDIDIDILKEISAFAEGFEFHPNECRDIGSVEKADGEWRQCLDKAVQKEGAIRSMCATPSGKIAIGYSKNKGGLSLYGLDDSEETPDSMRGVLVRGVSFLSDGRCAVLDLNNTLSIYSTAFEKQAYTFETLTNVEVGAGTICVDEQHLIYVTYKSGGKIQVFAPTGGAPLKELFFLRVEPYDFRVSPGGAMVLVSWRRIQVLDHAGQVRSEMQNNIANRIMVADVCSDDTMIVAYVSHQTGEGGVDLLTMSRYTLDDRMTLKETLFKDHPIALSPTPFYCIRELVTGEIAFCTKDRLYLFQKHPGVVNDVGFTDFDVHST